MDGLHVPTGGTHHIQSVLGHLWRSVEEGDDIDAVLGEHKVQQTAHAQPIQAINAASKSGNGQLGHSVLPLDMG